MLDVVSLVVALIALFISIVALIKSYEDRNKENLEKLIVFARESYEKIIDMEKQKRSRSDFYMESMFLPGFETYHLCMEKNWLTKHIDSKLLKEKIKTLKEVRTIICKSRDIFRNEYSNNKTNTLLTKNDVEIIREALSEIRKKFIRISKNKKT